MFCEEQTLEPFFHSSLLALLYTPSWNPCSHHKADWSNAEIYLLRTLHTALRTAKRKAVHALFFLLPLVHLSHCYRFCCKELAVRFRHILKPRKKKSSHAVNKHFFMNILHFTCLNTVEVYWLTASYIWMIASYIMICSITSCFFSISIAQRLIGIGVSQTHKINMTSKKDYYTKIHQPWETAEVGDFCTGIHLSFLTLFLCFFSLKVQSGNL